VFSAPLVGEVLLSSGLAQFLMKRNARGNFLVLPRPGAYQQRPLVWKEDAVVEDSDSQQIEADIAHLLELTNFQVDHHPGFRRSFLSTTRNFPLTRADRILDRFRVVGQRSDVPVLVIWGTRDGLIPISLWQYLYELIPHAKLKPINNGGHSIVAENSTAVASAMLQHFSELFPSAYCVG
jgi:pimeloyl-ACP methyl ester carboxylesterase